MTQKYEYDYEYQVTILKVCVQDPSFLRRYPDVIQPRFFSVDVLATAAKLILDVYARDKEAPTYTVLSQQANQYYVQYRVREETQGAVNQLIYRLYHETPQQGFQLNIQSVTATVCDFARRKSISRGIQEVLTLLDKGSELDRVLEIMRNSVSVGSGRQIGWSFFDAATVGLREKILDSQDYNPDNKIQTGFSNIDQKTFGGIGAGHIWTVAAKPKVGKSTLMCNIAGNAIYQHKRVFHYSFGDMNKLDVTVKYAQFFTGLTLDQLTQSDGAEVRLQRLLNACPEAHLEIVYESPGKVTVEDLYADVGFRSAHLGFYPDLVVVDYANKMRQPLTDNTYRSMNIIYEGLKELGDAYGCGVLTGVQIRRTGTREGSTEEDISDSWMQVADCDAMMILNVRENDHGVEEHTISLPIVRRGRSLPAFPVHFFKEIARIKVM